MDCSTININFKNNFKLETISDAMIVNMLDKIENRLLSIESDTDSCIVITRRVLNDMILKSEKNDYN